MQRARQLGRYHLLDRLACGGMAEIFRAKTFDARGQLHLVAIKRVLAHLAQDQHLIQMLVDEARIASRLRHPNITRVYEFVRAQGEYFLAMEHVDGKDLKSILDRCRAREKPLPIAHAAWIASEAAAALSGAHDLADTDGQPLRVVHRDVSPSNILCSYSGEVKLCDFGIAKATTSRVHTKTGVIKGKVKYMSPEQAMGRKLDHRSDIFSLGAVLYEMLALAPPFSAPNEMDLLLKVRDARFTPLVQARPGIPPQLAAIVERALARSKTERYQSAEEMGIALKALIADNVPEYTRSHLSRYLRKVFSEEIERELRLLEEYTLGEPNPSMLGENLIADALGPDALYTQFTPLVAHDAAPHRERKVYPGTPGGRAPKDLDPSIHDAPTLIIRTSRRR
ncbi:MAG: serine/threonine protein kinase [Deltaproteobacteria bacterium]|nr:serine/threonine protein kinase [Deltaproteobacteria bacterium]